MNIIIVQLNLTQLIFFQLSIPLLPPFKQKGDSLKERGIFLFFQYHAEKLSNILIKISFSTRSCRNVLRLIFNVRVQKSGGKSETKKELFTANSSEESFPKSLKSLYLEPL